MVQPILSNRALNALKSSFQIFSTFAVVEPTQPTKTEKSRLNPTQPMDNSAWVKHPLYKTRRS